jgi:putative Holliday junction resolvase
MRILALDHGSRRIGVAISDEMRTIAQPLEFISAEPFEEVVKRLREIIQQQNVGLILLGMPRNMDGSYGPAAAKTKGFAEALAREIPVPIRTWDERLTSVMANRSLIDAGVRRQKRKERVDKTAAAILLQSYLDNLPPEQ